MKISFSTKRHDGISENATSLRVGEIGLRVVSFQSIHDVDEKLWDSINSKKDLFRTHRFIRSVEDAKVENSRFWYLLFYSNDALVGTAVLSSFTISLDLFIGGILQRFIIALRRLLPHFLKVKILFCGLPISIGKNTITISDPSWTEELLPLLIREMEEIARINGSRFICFKEFLKDEIQEVDILTKYRFLRANSIPYVRMKVRWKDFHSYLAAMRHNYRRHILRSLKKMGQSEPLVHAWNSSHMNLDKPTVILGNPSLCPPKQFYDLYRNVMDRAKIKLEVLNKAFFENVYENMREDTELLMIRGGKQALAAALITSHDRRMTFLLAGLNYSKLEEFDVYFNLIYGIVSLAIQRGCTQLDLGQTAYWLKQCIGGEWIPVFFYIRSERPIPQLLLKTFQPLLFPELKLKPIRVFREGGQE